MRGRRAYAIEFGSEALVDSLPGVPPGASFVGSFDREQAVEDETRDFFASGHPLVEGLLAHVEDSPEGRVARLELRVPGNDGIGVIAIYKDGAAIEVRALDGEGRERQAWADALRRHPPAAVPMPSADAAAHDWSAIVSRLAAGLGTRVPHAIAAVVVRAPGQAARPR